MTFSLELSNLSGKSLGKIRGFPKLDDACAGAMALLNRRGGNNIFCTVCTGRGMKPSGRRVLTSLCFEYPQSYSFSLVLQRAEIELARLRDEECASAARLKFLNDNGGYDGPLGGAIFPVSNQSPRDQDLVSAFFRNDFAAVLKRFEEIKSIRAEKAGQL